MERIILYEYDRKNMKKIESAIENQDSKIVLLHSPSIVNKILNKEDSIQFSADNFYDLTPIIISEGNRTDFWSQRVIEILNAYIEYVDFHVYFIIDNRYANDVRESLYLYIDSVQSLETYLGIADSEVLNVVDINRSKFEELRRHFSQHLFGNSNFQKRLFEELQKYRLFNKIGEQKIFSVFICGQSGIGKTETARLFHSFLSPGEKFIKINLGNYSDQNALSSLIGSPRGYIGSNKGELSDKIFKSKSKVVLIDEFEKAGAQVHNFFLELLEDGKFTDSLGREFDLNKYIFVFTSNVRDEEVNKKISPELKSRFNLLYRFSTISYEEKVNYVEYKSNSMIEKIEKELQIKFSDESRMRIKNIDVKRIDNLRNINKEIMLNISSEYEKITGGTQNA
ncbi:MAG TPA: AAA family ATPase [Acetivibrio sp.]|jgi:hypothetical protein|nr:AAA family ATPase [Acetivibrio sp.]